MPGVFTPLAAALAVRSCEFHLATLSQFWQGGHGYARAPRFWRFSANNLYAQLTYITRMVR